jgi:hypothetical protein
LIVHVPWLLRQQATLLHSSQGHANHFQTVRSGTAVAASECCVVLLCVCVHVHVHVLKVLVSIQSLILVPEPYFNEPGYEQRGNHAASQQYNEVRPFTHTCVVSAKAENAAQQCITHFGLTPSRDMTVIHLLVLQKLCLGRAITPQQQPHTCFTFLRHPNTPSSPSLPHTPQVPCTCF